MGWIQVPRAGDPNRSTWARSSPGDGVLFPPGRPELACRDELLREEAKLRHRLDQLDLEAALLQREQAAATGMRSSGSASTSAPTGSRGCPDPPNGGPHRVERIRGVVLRLPPRPVRAHAPDTEPQLRHDHRDPMTNH